MSGHSKWANIKRRKGAEDEKRGRIFSKIARAIMAAVKEGGADPQANVRLRLILQQARAVNMPKSNVERALQRGEKEEDSLKSLLLEGYGPGGVAVMMRVLTDNRQRTVQEVRNFFQRAGGNLAEPGAVAFQFEQVEIVKTEAVGEEKILALLDFGVLDFKKDKDGVIFSLSAGSLEKFRRAAERGGIKIILADRAMKAKTFLDFNDPKEREKVKVFLKELEENEDIQRVFSNFHE